MSERYPIGSDPAAATTLPAAFYRDEEAHRLLLDRVFARSWQWLGPASALPEETGARPLTLLPGSLDEPLLATRDAAGAHHLLSNVCTHRGHLLAGDAVRAETLRCRYHGRCFRLDGAMRDAPGFEGARDFPRAQDDLPALPLRCLAGQLFTALAPRSPWEEWLAPVRERAGHLPLREAREDPAAARDFEVAAHWAVYVENFLEGFHVPWVHPGLRRALDLRAYRTACLGHAVLQTGAAARGAEAFALPEGHPDGGSRVAAWYFWLFPNLMINVYPWGISLNHVQPLGLRRCRVAFRSLVWDEDARGRGAGAALDEVQAEDEAVVARVQRGLEARLYDRGRYAPRHEAGVHHFHRLIAAALAGPGASAARDALSGRGPA